eukprot:TRINITY_DN1954_c0_g1_i1.p1 TRINITY_DN1954_c0_g1~~TRINITY_DN1954_c0_g1_i1.p1  ORF type:complete len:231 (+),score=73.15 TRINITY_DN1954_c0_g1_i1:26-694(+)
MQPAKSLTHALSKKDLSPNPIIQFASWYAEYNAIIPKQAEPSAMTLCTATKNGIPSARIVLLKSFDQSGFVFCTNYLSRKSSELLENPFAALVFYWDGIARQIRIEGRVEKATKEESDAIFDYRPRSSQIASIASQQSQPIDSRDALIRQVDETAAKYNSGELIDKKIERPETWGAWRVIPNAIEFWEGSESRLHNRFRYTRENTELPLAEDTLWKVERLQP